VVNYVSNEASKIPDIDDSKNVDKITEEIGMVNVKINPNSSLDNTHFKGEKGYDIEFSSKEHTGGKAIMYKNENESVRSILWNDHVLYKEGEGILAKIGDYEVTTDEKGDLKYQSQESIKKVLKAPSSAKFPSVNEWQFSKDKDKDEVIAHSYVDSQNGFGAMIRSEFQATYTFDKTSIKSLKIDGVEYIK